MLDEDQLVLGLSERGHHTRHIGDVVRAMRVLTSRLQDHCPGLKRWEDVTDADLVHVFGVWTANNPASTAVTRRSLVKCGLPVLVPPEAHERFPQFYTQGRLQRQVTAKPIEVHNSIPYDIYRAGGNGPWWCIFERLVRQFQMHSTW